MSKTELLVGRDEIVGDSGLFVDGDGQIVRSHEVKGDDHLGWGWGSIKRGLRSSVTAPFKAVKYSFTVPYRATKAYVTNKQLKGASDLTRFSGTSDLEEIVGTFVGDDVNPHDRALNQLIELYNRSVSGDEKALQAFGRVMSRLTSESQAGDPRAKKLLTSLAQAQAQSMQGDDVGASFLKKVDRLARKGLTAPFTATSWTSQQIAKGLRALPSPFDVTRVFRSHVPGGTFVGRDEIVGSHTSDDDLALAAEGSHADREALARHAQSSSGYNSHWKYMRGDDRPTGEVLEELRTRAAAGDPRAIKALAKLRRSTSGEFRSARPSSPKRTLTPAEQTMVTKIRSAMERAAAGDVPAQRQLTELRKEVPGLKARAQQGDEKAQRNLQILEDLGIFGSFHPIS